MKPERNGVRIVVYKDFLKSGRGVDRATAALANALAERGNEVHILTQQRQQEPLSVALHPDIVCHRVPRSRIQSLKGEINKLFLHSALGAAVLKRWLPGLDLMRETSHRLREAIAAIAPAVVISAGPNECVELTYAGGALPMPMIQMFQAYPPNCFRKNKYRRVDRLKAALPLATACQVLLPSQRETLRPYTDAPVVAIGNAIDYPVEEPLPPPETRRRVVLYMAPFTREKNHRVLLEAFARLQAADTWELHLYGTGKAERERALRAYAKALGIETRVRFFGMSATPRQELLRAAICAYPSAVEGFGITLAEAMWCGLPCVGFQTSPGVNELLVHEANGLLATSASAEAFAAQLQRLVDDPELRIRLGTIAAKTVRATYPAAKIWQQWEDLIARVCPASREARRGAESRRGSKVHISRQMRHFGESCGILPTIWFLRGCYHEVQDFRPGDKCECGARVRCDGPGVRHVQPLYLRHQLS